MIARPADYHCKGCNIDTPKSGKGRTVVVPPHFRDDLADHLERYVDKDAGAQLFPAAKGGCHLNDRVFLDYFTPALKALGREGVRVHDLRHFAGTHTVRPISLLDGATRLKGKSDIAHLVWPVATHKGELTGRRLVITFVPTARRLEE
jgi:integrase